MSTDCVLVERQPAYTVLRLNRADARNALDQAMVDELAAALEEAERAPDIRSIVLTGGRVFCAGADIEEMAGMRLTDALAQDFAGCCERLGRCVKPVIAAVEGYALGGGCELIEMCDVVVAASDSRFGHPEITLGALPGAGGTQRLARAIGRAKAMDLILTGRLMDAQEAERAGLVSRLAEPGHAERDARAIAAKLASCSSIALRFAKEATHRAVSVGLEDGLRLERRLFHLAFATGDLHAGMDAFLRKRR